MVVRRVLLVAILVGLVCADHAPAQDLTIATFNAEFLTRPKVHLKFGLPFNMGSTDCGRDLVGSLEYPHGGNADDSRPT